MFSFELTNLLDTGQPTLIMRPFFTIACGLFLCFPAPANAQHTSVRDSLDKAIVSAQHPDSIQKIITDWVNHCSTDSLCLNHLQFALKNHNPEFTIHFYHRVSHQYIRKEKFDEAITALRKCVQLSSAHHKKEYLPQIYILLGQMMSGKAQLDSALFYQNLAMEAYRQQGEEYHIWKVFLSRAMIYNQLVQTEAAISEMGRAYQIVKHTDNRRDKGYVLYYYIDWLAKNKAHSNTYFSVLADYMHFKSQEPEQSEHYHLEIISFDSPREGIELLEHHLKSSEEYAGFASLGPHHMLLADLYMQIEHFNTAAGHYALAVNYFEQGERTYMLKYAYAKLYEAHRSATNYSAALSAFEKLKFFEDSLFGLEQQKAVLEIQERFESEVKDRQLAEQALLIEKQTNQVFWIAGGSLLMLMAALWFYSAQRKRLRHRANLAEKEQQIQKIRISDLEREQKLLALNAMIKGQEDERMRIARDLHDGVGGLLTALKSRFQSNGSNTENLTMAGEMAGAGQIINRAYEEVRRVSHNLMPLALEITGLQGALEDLGESLRKGGIHCEMYLHNLPHKIESTTQIMIFRIAQELVQNIQKHADATQVLIQVIGQDDHFHITVEDNGKGFSEQEIAAGFGLESVRSRLQYLNGTIQMESAPDEGTSFQIMIPFKTVSNAN